MLESFQALEKRLSAIQARMDKLEGRHQSPTKPHLDPASNGSAQGSDPSALGFPAQLENQLRGDPAMQGQLQQTQLQQLVQQAGQKQGVSPQLLNAVMRAESNGNPVARSPKGALGLMQLMPGTARELGVDAMQPAQNLQGGAAYLRKMGARFGTLDQALAAYNAGPGSVEKYGGVPPFAETKAYVQRVRKFLGESQTTGRDIDTRR